MIDSWNWIAHTLIMVGPPTLQTDSGSRSHDKDGGSRIRDIWASSFLACGETCLAAVTNKMVVIHLKSVESNWIHFCYGLTFQWGVDVMDTEAGGPPGRRRGGETDELFAQCGYIWNAEDNLITVVALQETSLEKQQRGVREVKKKSYLTSLMWYL